MIAAEHESVRADGAGSTGFGDAVTFAFGDPEHRLYGSARFGLVPGEPVRGSGLGLLFREDAVIAVEAVGGIEVERADWSSVEVGDLGASILEPLRAWEVRFDADEGGFELRFEALGPPAEVGGEALATGAADLHGYEQLCRVTGTARCGEERVAIDCLGQRGHQWGAPDWERLALARTVALWFEDGAGVTLASTRPQGADGHARETTRAFLLEPDAATPIEEPRLSTISDEQGRQRRAGLELWVSDEDEESPRRAAGQAVCGTTLDLGRLRLDCAFFEWRMEGLRGVGRYDVLRHAS
jgi:hypothetical protein